jgi:hypothetical protein
MFREQGLDTGIGRQRAMWEARTDRMSALVEKLHQEDLSNDKRNQSQP